MIVFENVHKSFGPKVVLDGLTLEIPTGETMAIIGQSGSGRRHAGLLIGILASTGAILDK
jgi:ABC-type transporter Mla maintaining outer membrane lipid asymmetry ATPase subunit MlaF